MLGMEINVGEKFIDAVGGNDMIGWHILNDKDKAIDRVYAGEYYAAVIIPEDFSDKIMSFTSGALQHPVILFYENEKSRTLRAAIEAKPFRTAALMTGAEGGFAEEEIAKAEAAGLRICTLGTRILRCETAPLAALSALMYAAGEL